MKNFDIAIIGGGPAGYNAAANASANGLQVVLFEHTALGGVCLNEGCIPTKTLLHSANLLDEMRESAAYGIHVEGAISANYAEIVARKDKIVKTLTGGVSYKLKGAGVTVISKTARLTGEEGDRILVATDDETYAVSYVLLATGSETAIPPIPGLSEVGYWTSREALSATTLPKDITIIGGGVIGMEFAGIYTSLGVPVRVIEMAPEILGAMDSETSGMLRKEYARRGIQFYLETKVTAVSAEGVSIETKDGKTEVLPTSQILLSVGRRPVTDGLGLETLSIQMNRAAVVVNEYMQTSHPRVYAAGDITGFSMLAHTAIREGEVAINHIVGGSDDRMRYDSVPAVVYMHPEIAGVGATEEKLRAEGRYYRVLKLPMAYAGRYVVENEQAPGLCKVLVDENDTILGCHILGNPASELILLAGIAVTDRSCIEDFRRHIFPHPTAGEILHEVLFS
ncbi:dihydrolipoyl dehydrogenase [Porphyromonas sp. oral taxon 279 str. F0450]|uniref:dihydrolipoyl dehydrogenase n=1 Tax=Porphyromonas sp. oral taxon 279 TaxID=712438 RepID=UPI00027C32CB|nr:dihydrolipoyl dehydrogenase [Porphyromonas sp. oral taxon 279]EJU15168.1 dihydrolipoyl dehydrogenase [Porphyromonas sp. oral taxon 279 str. F0450]